MKTEILDDLNYLENWLLELKSRIENHRNMYSCTLPVKVIISTDYDWPQFSDDQLFYGRVNFLKCVEIEYASDGCPRIFCFGNLPFRSVLKRFKDVFGHAEKTIVNDFGYDVAEYGFCI